MGYSNAALKPIRHSMITKITYFTGLFLATLCFCALLFSTHSTSQDSIVSSVTHDQSNFGKYSIYRRGEQQLADKVKSSPRYSPPNSSQFRHLKQTHPRYLFVALSGIAPVMLLLDDSPQERTPRIPWHDKTNHHRRHRISDWRESNLLYKGCITYHS